jgi:hypothetical protein
MAWDHGVDYELPKCPVCGRECSTIYQDIDGYNLGCNKCVRSIDAYEFEEEK